MIHDPLKINLHRQKTLLLSSISPDTTYSEALNNASSSSQLLATLSTILAVPAYTQLIATLFRPILIDLCTRWLESEDESEHCLVALCYLVEVHEELFPILHQLLLNCYLEGPLAIVVASPSPLSINVTRLHQLLLAYYRILQANRELPGQFNWSLKPLSQLIWTPYLDNGTRILAIRCYSLQSGMCEEERCKLETEVLGELCGVDCQLYYGQNLDGTSKFVDGWIMPVVELKRVKEERDKIITEPIDYFSTDPSSSLELTDLSPLLANVHGVLLLKSSRQTSVDSALIPTPSSTETLKQLALHLSLRLPILLTSAPSAGKSLLIHHLSKLVHPERQNQIVTVHLADTSLDPRAILGSYVSSTMRPGTFEWKEGVLVRSMREGRWVVFEDVDKGSNEVLGVIKPLVESLSLGKWIGGRATLDVPSRGRVVAHDQFMLFATRSVLSRNDVFHPPTFFGAHKFHEIVVQSPPLEELCTIVNTKFVRLAPATRAIVSLWDSVRSLRPPSSGRDIGIRELERFCRRIDSLLPVSYQPMDISSDSGKTSKLSEIFPSPSLREDMYLEARDVFFGAGALTASTRTHTQTLATTVGQHLGLELERQEWVLQGKTPEFEIEKDASGRSVAVCINRTRLPARIYKVGILSSPTRPFAMHRPAVLLLSRIASAISHGEPVLLTGETGTGKTSIITHLASLLHCPLISLNLSHQTESSDLIGGLKPVDARISGSAIQEKFTTLFATTFSRKKNEKFETEVRKAVNELKWKRAVGLWKESVRLAVERIQAKEAGQEKTGRREDLSKETPRKRRKTEHAETKPSRSAWTALLQEVEEFEVQHVHGKGKFAFGFVEGPLVKALRSGDWVLLDEVNLASAETLECISSLLDGPTASITLTEHGSLEPVPRHPDFRLFACMNPATDVGKKDLPPNIRTRFTEIDVPSPDADKDTLLSIITQYIGPNAVGDKGIIMDIAEFYSAVKKLSESRQISDGDNHRPHFSMRTLTRALTFAADTASAYSLRRSVWEGCLMAFTMILDSESAQLVTSVARKHLLAGVRNPRSMLIKEPSAPKTGTFVKFGPFYLEKGPLEEDLAENYILTPSVQQKLIDLARIILTRRFPILIEGPTSSGKTSSIEYLAKRTGHHFVRINNHEHTDIQEYLGSYVSDPLSGRLVFNDGLLVQALREGHWIVLDELNLAPTDVMEALNRLLDDNRELVIPETQEVVRPHPHFMLFATQNPPGLYAGRKVLSRAFRNRFLEVHFEDVPQTELETILCQRCQIAPSYGKKIVTVFHELQKRRQTSRVFESKHGFATLRDLFRWAGRDAVGYQELADNGYMLLAERTRRAEDKAVVKEVIESVMGVRIDEDVMYNLNRPDVDMVSFLGHPIPTSSKIIWTKAMQRLYTLVCRGLKFNEPILLVGDTGSGKTSVCQVYADASSQSLLTLNCHQNTETADLLGGLRPVRNRATHAGIVREATVAFKEAGIDTVSMSFASENLISTLTSILKSHAEIAQHHRVRFEELMHESLRLQSIFEWHNGPLINAMNQGDIFLLDEISLADDSVLERLNSVLEPGRSIVLAERGGTDSEQSVIRASEDFKLVATMNPGGDYGKKELSPALRNRFTEIWVPPVDDRSDLELIVGGLWQYDSLQSFTMPMLDFIDWLCLRVGDRTLLSLRDILAWVLFTNAAYNPEQSNNMPCNEIFHHAAHMTYLDGLSSLPQFTAYSRHALEAIRSDALEKLQALVQLAEPLGSFVPAHDPSTSFQLGSFAIPKGTRTPLHWSFNFTAPTTLTNAMRVIRACQVPKPILLEGSPGVGKTSLVTALSNISGHELCRINLSDQTDLIDLFGSDLPVEGGSLGEFAWRDAEFLKAMKEGHWVLLDEMNLAPQAVLEGLNAILDHRGTVYIPELNRSFSCHPSFRIFAAQNPLSQGGGRKGLPKSFVNRFSKVYIEELTPSDLYTICQHAFPAIEENALRAMVSFNAQLNEQVGVRHTFAHEGSPWEFNLRDITRWGALLSCSGILQQPQEYLRSVYLHRFRSQQDRQSANSIFNQAFSTTCNKLEDAPAWILSATHIQVGHFTSSRKNMGTLSRPRRILKSQLSILESLGDCVAQSWLAIVTGRKNCGKTDVVRALAHFTGNQLQEISMNSATDTMDILGSFEQVDNLRRLSALIDELILHLEFELRSITGSAKFPELQSRGYALRQLCKTFSGQNLQTFLEATMTLISSIIDAGSMFEEEYGAAKDAIHALHASSGASQFEWVDGPLIKAMKSGHWLLMDGANLCSPSVLDRLNSLCESEGFLVLSERGFVDGRVQLIKPHPNFRLFMSVDPQYGELSRAMRNRGVEIALLTTPLSDDHSILLDHYRLPLSLKNLTDPIVHGATFDAARRGLLQVDFSEPNISSTGRSLDQDSALSSLVDQVPTLLLSSAEKDEHPWIFFLCHSLAPAYMQYLTRYLASCDHTGTISPMLYNFMSNFPNDDLRTALKGFWQSYALHGKVSSSYLLTQQKYFNRIGVSTPDASLGLELPSSDLMVFEVLNLAAALYLLENSATPEKLAVNRSTKYNSELAYASAAAILDEIQTVCRKILKMSGTGSSSNLIATTLALSVLDCGLHLKKAICSASFDFSTVTAVSQWLVESLENCPSLFMGLHDRANLLRNLVSPSSGLGLSDIWSTLYIERLSENTHESVKRTENLSRSLKTSPTSSSLRCQAFNVMCLEMLPISLVSRDAPSLSDLKTTLDECLFANASGQQLEQPCHVNPQSLFVELYALTLCRRNQELQSLSAVLQELVRLTSHDKNGSLLRIVPYQHLVWACEIGTASSAIIVRAQMSWLEGLWNGHCKTAKFVGPTLLFHSTHLHILIVACDWNGIQLLSLADHEINIRQQVRMAIFQSKQLRSRVFQLIEVLNITLATIASCFSNSDDQSSYDTIGDTDLSVEDFHSYWANVLTSLECSRNEFFLAAIQEHLRPLLNTIAEMDTLQSIGACWIALSRFILSLVIPDAPVDPAVVKACSFDRIRYHENSLRIQICLHHELERLLTGNADNELTRILKPRLQNVNEQLGKVPNLPNRNDVSRLHLFWSEVSQFQKNIILSKKVEGLLDALLNGNEDAIFRERVTQESLTGFYQRLDSVYPEFADISILLKLAVLYMQIGLRLAVQSANLSSSPSSPSASLVSSLLAFPSVASCNLISKNFKAIKSSDTTAISQILITLAALSMERSLGTDSKHYLNMVDEAYDQAMRLWLIDRAKETEGLEASNTLYRHSNLHHEAVTDAEIEEAEFLELFPTYEDALESDSTHISNGKPRPSRLVQEMDMVLLVDIHHDLVSQRSTPPSAIQSRFDTLRSRIIQLLVTCSPESLPQTLDQTSVHFQISLLHGSLSQLDNVQSSTKSPYNFYKDQNIVQLRGAANVLSALKQRLQVISDEWPDQMVLKHLIERCDAILMLRSNTPVAKVLSAVEQLLVHTEDWEMYANRENTIKVHRDALIHLIVEWRRMELSCWQTLLDSQATLFSEEISEWWFRLYNALIRGSLSAAEQECSGDRQSLDQYIETLIPLLDSFVTSSPLGQFAARIELLGSFEKYVTTTGSEKAPSYSSTMERVRRVLHSTHRYYDSFSDRLEKRLMDQKAELEKEVRKFVKLASWKDINVQALKESAQRTHHQLYKTIKKWRDVLRQPVAGHIQPWTAEAPESQPLPMDILSELHLSVSLSRDTLASEAQSSVTIPSYLLHLERTLQRCDLLIEQQLRPCVGSHSAQIVDDIAVEIITTSNELASISIPPKPGTLREKQRKGLLVRKRKAWADMLKGLKRMGLASNVKPEILRQNMDQLWIREQPIMPIIPQSEFILRNGEIYFVKLSGSLPDLRASLSNHHSDLSTRELHRGRMFLESGFSMAVDLRARLAIALDLYQRMNHISQRLQQICSSDENVLVGANLQTHVVCIKDLLCKLSSGLSEVHKNAGIHDQLEPEGHVTDNFLENLSTLIQTTDVWRDRLVALSNQINISVFPVLTKEEETLLLDVKTHLLQLSSTISSWRDRYPRFHYLILPLQEWLNDQDVVSLLPINPSLTLDNISLQPLLDAFLISIQSLISRCPVTTDDGASEELENYISNGYKFVRDFTHLLGLDKITALIDALLIELSSCTNFRPILTKIFPFLEIYLNLVRDHLSLHNNWTKSLFKLSFILCTVMQTLSQQGFCQPLANDNNDEGGEVEVDAAGMGIGDGSGNDDVSKEIEDESQIEGLQGDDVENKEREGKHDNDDAIEMNDDFGGALEDIPDAGSESDMESDADNEPELDETLENLDDLDNSAVDEKMWGDEKGPEDKRNSEDQTNKDHSKKQDDSSEVVGKEGKEQKQSKEKQSEEIEELDGKDESGAEENEGDESNDPNVSGAPMNDQVPDANTLDLPDDINVSGDDVDMSDGSVDGTGMEQDDDGMGEEDQRADDATPDAMDDDQVPDNALENQESACDVNNDEAKGSEHADDEASSEVVAPPDISEGVGMTDSTEPSRNEPRDNNSTGELGTSSAGGQGPVTLPLPDHEKAAEDNRPLENVEPAGTKAAEGNGSGSTATGLQPGQAPVQNEMQTTPNPLRSLGDVLKAIRHRFEDILSPQQRDAPVENMEECATQSQIQYLQPEDVDHDMQALAPAGEEKTAKLEQLTLIDDGTTSDDRRAMDVDMPLPAEEFQRPQPNNSVSEQRNDVETAITRDTLGQYSEVPEDLRETAGQTLEEDGETDDHTVEMQLRSWRVADYPDEGADQIWRSYESLTHDLAYALCEQLRLILEPTLATRLKGDYRTGKRLNMKKVISYIASDYTKDKIWLRRTKPSQREYQVLISIDDSRSMAESHSIHLAYQTLALISKALSRLESGDIAIIKFGEAVDLLHGFNEGPFTDQAGTKIMNAFRFQQKATNVLSLLETSLTVLESARERQATNSSSAADLWQLQIIISDGICQDHDKLRILLRKANEQRVMVVFIILDSLHVAAEPGVVGDGQQGSIISMDKAEFKNVDGKMELQLQKYLDSFPFEYYVVLRNVEALPEVLAGTLKQFFERITDE